MKKIGIFLLSLSLLLAACQDESTVGQQEEEQQEQQGQQEPVADYRQAYANVLTNYVENTNFLGYGQEFISTDYRYGLVYADLIDFDQDGFEELYVVYKDSEYLNGTNDYVQEVWSTTDANTPAKKLSMEELPQYEESNMSILWEGLGFVTLENEQVGIRVTAQDLAGQMPHDEHVIYTLQDGQLAIQDYYSLSAVDNWTYKKNGKVIVEQDYTAETEALHTNTTWIVEDNYGPDLKYGIDVAQANKQLNELQQQSNKYLAGSLEDSEKLSETQLQQVKDVLVQYKYLNYLDVKDKQSASSIAVYYIFSNQLEHVFTEEYLLQYDVAKIISKAKEEFGIELVAADFESLVPPDAIYYEDGQLISSIFDGFVLKEKYEILGFRQLKDTLYYIEYGGLHIDTYAEDFPEERLALPIEQWNDLELSRAVNDGVSYIIIDTAKQPKLLYKSHTPLTEEQLEQY